MLRILIDTNGVDPIADEPGAYETVRAAVTDGRLEILYPHVTRDEITDIPDSQRRASLLRVLELGTPVTTAAFILNVSLLDEARLGGDQEAVDAVATRGKNKYKDALVAITAQYDGLTLVTNDQDMIKKARRQRVAVMEPAELLASL